MKKFFQKLNQNEIFLSISSIMKKSLILVFAIVFISWTKCSPLPESKAPSSVRVMSFNVENMFDGTEQGSEYPKFNPKNGSWTEKDYMGKLLQISRVTMDAAPDGPDIVGFQEIENKGILTELTKGYLKDYGYKYIVISENPNSSIQSGFISKYPYNYVKYHIPQADSGRDLRQIVEVSFDIHGHELIILNNHWKSKVGKNTEPKRLCAADVVNARIKSILEEKPKAEILLLGDFNECADEYVREGKGAVRAIMPAEVNLPSRFQYLRITGDDQNKNPKYLFSPWLWDKNQEPGSYIYRGRWETIDNFFLGSNLTDKKGFYFAGFKTVKTQWNTSKKDHPRPYDKASGEGCSDHFPILLELNLEK